MGTGLLSTRERPFPYLSRPAPCSVCTAGRFPHFGRPAPCPNCTAGRFPHCLPGFGFSLAFLRFPDLRDAWVNSPYSTNARALRARFARAQRARSLLSRVFSSPGVGLFHFKTLAINVHSPNVSLPRDAHSVKFICSFSILFC